MAISTVAATENDDQTAVEIQVTESVSVSDQVDLASAEMIVINESVSVSDLVDLVSAEMIVINEQIAVTDSPLISIPLLITVNVQESIVVVDQVALVIETPLFVDGFETGDTLEWSTTSGG